MRLAIISTHPVQYYAPVFRLLHQRKNITIKVFYTWGDKAMNRFDRGFGKTIEWDIPLLDGYDYEWVENISADPGSHTFNGIINPGLNNLIESWQPDAILVYGWAYKSHLKAMRYFKGRVPVYFRGDSTLLNRPRSLKQSVKNIFLRWVYTFIDHAFYVGTNNKAYFKKYGLKEHQLSFAPHAIDNNRFGICRKDEAEQLRNSFSITDGDILVLYAGKFEHVKNVELLLWAFINLNLPNVHLLLVGNGDKEHLLKNMAVNSVTAGRIHFSDFKNQQYMPVLYQSADLFCLPSLSETWGLAVNEAMACGSAVLVSNKVGCAADLVKGNKNGLIFKSGNVSDLQNALQMLTRSKTLLQDFGKNSARLIQDWNFENIAEAIETKLINEAK